MCSDLKERVGCALIRVVWYFAPPSTPPVRVYMSDGCGQSQCVPDTSTRKDSRREGDETESTRSAQESM